MAILLPWTSRITEKVYRPGVLALLKSAPLLQELELEFDMPGSDTISIYFLEALTLPNLRVVSFDSMCFLARGS
jgi:hypothetical protein